MCEDVEALCQELSQGAGAVFLTEEALYMKNSHGLEVEVKRQEPWSDLPFVVLTSRGDENERVAKTSSLLEPLANVTVIERPVRPATILTALRAAIRNRRKQYEVRRRLNQLRSSYDRLSMTLRAASAGSWEWSARDNELFWSPEFYDIFGLPHEPPTIDALKSKVLEPDVERVTTDVRRAINNKTDFRTEFRIDHPIKGRRWIAIFGQSQLISGDVLVGISGIAIDITERKMVQEDLEHRVRVRTQELVAANEEMQGFTYSVSHDLRAPLRAIVSTSSILLEELAGNLSREHRSLLERQALNANKLGTLIDDLLKMSRLSRQQMKVSVLDLTRVAREVADEVLRTNAFGSARVQVQPEMCAIGDEKLIRLLLQNLIENACKFSPKGGLISVGMKDEGDRHIYFVRDQGIGFEMRYAPKLFMPFERLVADSEYPGTGIGLTNVQRIVARHGGRVWAESEGQGKGSTFYFTLGAYVA